jgi:O-acetyl-ADP-ribose deacetylase (regulator of RNase III)
MAENKKMIKLGGDRVLYVSIMDICSAPTDAIVNAANVGLSHGGGVAGHIAQQAGQALEDECEEIIKKKGMLRITEAVSTTAGRLPYKGVIHVAGPTAGSGNEGTKLTKTIIRGLKLAEKRGWKSIAFPAISTGIYGISPKIFAKAFSEAIRYFYKKQPVAVVNTIYLCLTDDIYSSVADVLTAEQFKNLQNDQIDHEAETMVTDDRDDANVSGSNMPQRQTDTRALPMGVFIKKYKIEKILGYGGFGITYLATDTEEQKNVAIKEYMPNEIATRTRDSTIEATTDNHKEQFGWGLDRFVEEAQILYKFNHPGIINILDITAQNNTAYIIMPYETGDSLQTLLSPKKTLVEKEIINIIRPIMEGLKIVHEHGFIHRDIKPANIYIRNDNTSVLLDFGSARQAMGEMTKTLTSLISPGYAPYEQYHSKSDEQGPWTDIYAIAATMYRCIAGISPKDALDRSREIINGDKESFVTANELGKGNYSDDFLNAIDAGLLFNYRERPQTTEEWSKMFHFS